MKTVARLTLAAGAVLVCACTSENPQQPLSEPLRASFSDGAHAGNPDFFFLPPLFKSPTTNPNYEPNAFNEDVRPTVEICELDPLTTPPVCGPTIKTFAAAEVTRDVANQQYQVNWKTDESHLVVTNEYRIRVLLGAVELGYADVDPVSSGSQLKNVNTGEFIGLVDGRTLPIKFRVEDGAACFGGACNSKTIVLAQGGFVVLESTGDRVDIPAQQSNQIVNVTVEQCDDIDVDLPVFGNCLRVTADPPLAAPLFPLATVSICSLDPLTLPLSHEQSELLSLHRQDAEAVTALQHSGDFCTAPIGRREDAPTNFAARSLRALRDLTASIFKPAMLHASSIVLDVGQGGQTDGFSDFQFALPSQINADGLLDFGEQLPGAIVPASVAVTDVLGQPVAGATVRFNYNPPSGLGGAVSSASERCQVGTADDLVCTTDAFGLVSVDWHLSSANAAAHALQARGRGMGIASDLEGDGPFDPCVPVARAAGDIVCTGTSDVALDLDRGAITFTATTAPATGVLTFLQQPTDQIGNLRTLAVRIQAQDVTGAALPGVQVTLGDGPRNASLGCGMGGATLSGATDATGQVVFTLVDVSAACETATLLATGAKVGFTTMQAESRPFVIADLGGTGTPTIDGQFDESWAGARCLQFSADVPEGGTTPALLCAMNDETNLYFLVRFTRGPDPRSSVDFQLDANRSGGINSGDDLIVFRNPESAFEDDYWFDNAADDSCPVGSLCSRADEGGGGSSDGQGAFGNNGGETIYEVAHPLRSGDNHDVSAGAGQTINFVLGLNIYPTSAPTGQARTFFPSGRLLKLLVK